MAEFNTLTPPIKITNPKTTVDHGRVYQEYPRHLHRAGGEFYEVTTDADKATKLAEGWFLTPDAATAAVDDAAPQTPVTRGRRKAAAVDYAG